ncbi:DUF3108 domain-containing protein [Terrihabitans sp. B22-R8]|uniref:DUF3108 domain-containing protein n=1 Tax=Terrihabitans sp. B22-R8 TaxID=3425128 RepID=UPI00403C2418
MTHTGSRDNDRRAIRRRLAVAALAASAALSVPMQAQAETKLTAKYNARLSYLPIVFATGTLTASLPQEGRYSVDFGADGIGFAMSGKAVGTVIPGGLSPVSAAIDTKDSSEKRSIRIALSRGKVRRELVTPPVPYRADRVPITQAHRNNVIDPISALMMPVSVDGAPLDAANCNRVLRIFEGTERFDIRLSYLRTEQVKSLKGYEGQALVCRANYKAVAGHRKVAGVEYMENNQSMEAWLVPIDGTNLLAPWKVSLGTKIGTMILEAEEFTASGGTKRAEAAPLDATFQLRTTR